jgi:hypothetical protein
MPLNSDGGAKLGADVDYAEDKLMACARMAR